MVNNKIDYNSESEKITGIYCISNLKYFYIGHSKDIFKRWSKHRSLLKRNKHVNPIMQNVYNKYKDLDPFKFEIVLECEIQDLQKKEGETVLEYVYKFPEKKCMNIANPIKELEHFVRKDGKLINISEELAEPLKKYEGKTVKRGSAPWKYRKIVQLDKDGNLIKIWDTTKHAEQELGIHIHMKKHTCGGFQWQRYDEWKEILKGRVNHKHNIDDTIKQFSLSGQFIREFKNSKEIKNVYPDISLSSLSACLNKQYKSCYNYLWSYSFEAPNYNSKTNRTKCRKPVYQFDKFGKFIKEWNSKQEASEETGISLSAIKNNLNGSSKTGGGYIWKYQK